MEQINGQTIIEVPAPLRCLIDETKFRIEMNDAIKLRNDLTIEINKLQQPVADFLGRHRPQENKEQ